MKTLLFHFYISFTLLVFALLPSAVLAQIVDPTDVSDLVVWVDAQDVNGTGVQPANGTAITTWTDKSGNGNNLTTAAGTVTFEQTGFDNINPGLRFPLVARMAAANPFNGTFQNEMTVFFVNANETSTNNFAVTLNGQNTGAGIANGRFSFHTPWTDGNIYFDAGACCGATRLRGASLNGLTETTLYTGLNDAPDNLQLLRVDGSAFLSDNSGHNANVSQGVHLGDLTDGNQYNGRFAEVVVYERALSLAEIEDVECYLLAKWKPASAPSGCIQPIAVTKTHSAWDPLGTNELATPGNDVLYEVIVSKPSGAGLSEDSIFVVDSLPQDVSFYNDDVDDAGSETNPIGFSQVGTGVNFTYGTDIGFSSASAKPNSFAECTYVPASGYDPNVRHICINPKGAFIAGSSTVSFTLFFRVRIN